MKKRKMPTKICILGMDFTVKYKTFSGAGHTNTYSGIITVNSKLSPSAQRTILQHEIAETILALMNAINDDNGRKIILHHDPKNNSDSFMLFLMVFSDTLSRNNLL